MNTLTQSQPIKNNFFVYIVESPSPKNIYSNIAEGKALSETLTLAGIPSTYRLAVDLEQFKRALSDGLVDSVRFHKLKPIIHISAHGNTDGITLTDGNLLGWKNLRMDLLPVNKGLNGMILCLSSCFGYSGTRMSMFEDDGYPFDAIVANSGMVSYSETNIGYSVFYHLFSKGYSLDEATKIMREASGNKLFLVETGIKARQGYQDFLKSAQLNTLNSISPPRV